MGSDKIENNERTITLEIITSPGTAVSIDRLAHHLNALQECLDAIAGQKVPLIISKIQVEGVEIYESKQTPSSHRTFPVSGLSLLQALPGSGEK